MDTRIAYSLLTLIEDRAASVLKPDGHSFLPQLRVVGNLLEQLRDPKKVMPEGLTLGLASLLDELSVFDVLGDEDSPGFLGKLRDRVGGLGKKFLDGNGVEAVRELLKNLWSAQAEAGQRPLLEVLRRHLGLGITFVTTLRNLADLDLADRISDGWSQYFFGEKGFETADGISIVPPAHGELLAALAGGGGLGLEGLTSLKGILKEPSAAR